MQVKCERELSSVTEVKSNENPVASTIITSSSSLLQLEPSPLTTTTINNDEASPIVNNLANRLVLQFFLIQLILKPYSF